MLTWKSIFVCDIHGHTCNRFHELLQYRDKRNAFSQVSELSKQNSTV